MMYRKPLPCCWLCGRSRWGEGWGGVSVQPVSCRGGRCIWVRLVVVGGLSVAAAMLLLVAVEQAVCSLTLEVLSLLEADSVVRLLSLLVWALIALRQQESRAHWPRPRPQPQPQSRRRLVGVNSAWLRRSVQLVYLRPRGLHDHQLVLGNVCGCRGQVSGRLGLDALEVHVAALPLLLLPGHADERTLDVVVDDLRTTSRTPLHLLFISRVAW